MPLISLLASLTEQQDEVEDTMETGRDAVEGTGRGTGTWGTNGGIG